MEGYKKQLKVYNVKIINNIAVAIFFVAFIVGAVINFVATDSPYLATGKVWGDMILSVGLLVVGVFVHEGIHALAALIFGKTGGENIVFGIKPKEGFLFCHCKAPITVNAYRIMLILPFIITAVIPYIVTVITGGLMLIAVFSMLMSGAAGDLVMFFGLIKIKDGKNRRVLDHPDTVGYYLLYKEDELPDGFSEMTEEEEKAYIEKNTHPVAERTRKGMMLKILGIGVFCALVVVSLYIIALIMKII